MFQKLSPALPGMRTIKTALAVVLGMFIVGLYSDNSPFFTGVAAVIVMQNSLRSSWKAGWNRLIGTIIGAFVGLIFNSLFSGHLVVSGLGIIIVIYLTNLLKQNDSINIACIVFLAIVLNVKGDEPVMYALNRVFETIIGIASAMLINRFVFPPKEV